MTRAFFLFLWGHVRITGRFIADIHACSLFLNSRGTFLIALPIDTMFLRLFYRAIMFLHVIFVKNIVILERSLTIF